MSRMCIEDGFEYNIKQAIKDVMQNHESKEEFLQDVDGGDEMASALYEQAFSYMDIVELASEVWDEKHDV